MASGSPPPFDSPDFGPLRELVARTRNAGRLIGWGRVLVAILLLVLAGGSWYIVEPDSQGLVRRFGAYDRTTGSGLHFKLPWIEDVEMVLVDRQYKLEFGFASPESSDIYQGSQEPALDSNLLTGDLNSLVVEWVVQYKIDDPYEALYRNEDAVETLRDLAESTMRQVVGDRALDEVLTVGRQEVEAEALRQLREQEGEIGLGLSINALEMKGINPPQEVRSAFSEVNTAQQRKETIINEAQREENQRLPRAEGQAQRILAEARAEATEIVATARGEVAEFDAIYAEFERTPAITRERLYLEMLDESGASMGELIVVPGGSSGETDNRLVPLLPLMLRHDTATTPNPASR